MPGDARVTICVSFDYLLEKGLRDKTCSPFLLAADNDDDDEHCCDEDCESNCYEGS